MFLLNNWLLLLFLFVFHIIAEQHAPRLEFRHIIEYYFKRCDSRYSEKHSPHATKCTTDYHADDGNQGVDANFVAYDHRDEEVVVNKLHDSQDHGGPHSISGVVGTYYCDQDSKDVRNKHSDV